MTPTALRRTRTRLGLTARQLAHAAGYKGGQVVGALERSQRPYVTSRAVRLALLEQQCRERDIRLRLARRARAAHAWVGDPRHTALEAAAHLLDTSDEPEFADWLLRAHPGRAVEVATYTAVHALLRGEAAVFDTLMEAGLIDDDAFMDVYLGVTSEFIWSPGAAQLLP